MLIKLPIVLNDRIVNKVFQIKEFNNHITIDLYDENNLSLIDILIRNNFNGIIFYQVCFPMIFTIHKNYLFNEYFFIFLLLYNNENEFNFLYLFLEKLNNFSKKKKYMFPHLKNINDSFFKKFIESINLKYDELNKIKDKNKYLNKLYNKVELNLNITLFTIFLEVIENNNYNIELTKKNNNYIIFLKNYKFNFFGNNNTLKNHIIYIKSDFNEIKEKNFYFVSNRKKILRLYIDKIVDDNIYINKKILNRKEYNIYPYNPKYLKDVTIINLFKQLSCNNLFNIIKNMMLKKNNMDIMNIFLQNKNNLFIINKLIVNDYNIDDTKKYLLITNNLVSINYFKNVTENLKEFNLEIFKNLNNEYTYPILYAKRCLSDTFVKIIYYSKLFLNQIIDITSQNFVKNKIEKFINFKLKSIYIIILKCLYYFERNDISFLNNTKIYTEQLYHNIFKIIFFKDNNYLLEKNVFFYKCSKLFIENTILIKLINLISWDNIKHKIIYMRKLINSVKNQNSILLYDNRINRTITNIYIDQKIKKIIINPLYMFNYLKHKKDFVKWLFVIKNNINDLFYNKIKIKDCDIYSLGKILHYLLNIKIQDINDDSYLKKINYFKKNANLLLYKERINIKLKDINKNYKINLGYLSKHINNISTITISDDESVTNTVEELTDTIKKYKKRYFKYKTKYLNYKISEASSSIRL